MPPEPVLVLRHERAALAELSRWIDERVAAFPLDRAVAYAVRLCLEEAVLNIVTHATAGPEIRVDLKRDEAGLVATIEDHGQAFDPAKFTVAAPAVDLAQAYVGGRGILLIRRFSSGMEYRRQDGINHLTLRFAS